MRQRSLLYRRIVPGLVVLGVAVGVAGGTSAPLERAGRYRFEQNVGQAPEHVRFLARTSEATLWLTDTEAVFASRTKDGERVVMRQRMIGGLPAAPEGRDALALRLSEFRGDDPTRWRRDIPVYGRVMRAGVWPGIDVQYRPSGTRLEYDFLIAPGADASRIRFDFEGLEGIVLDDRGSLRLHAGNQEVVHLPPRAWQDVEGARTPVEVRFALDGGTVGFLLGERDPRYPLVIDPVVHYSSYLGGSGDEEESTRVEGLWDGSAIVAMTTSSPGLPTTGAGFDDGGTDVFVARVAPDGGSLLWATYLGGSGIDRVRDLAVNFAGDPYVVGYSESTDFPRVDPVQPGCDGQDGFVTRIAANGAGMVYSTCFGGEGSDRVSGVWVDLRGEATIAGETDSDELSGITAQAFQPTRAGNVDAFVARLRAHGHAVRWTTYLGGEDVDLVGEVASDGFANILVAGSTFSESFPTTPGAYQTGNGGGETPLDAFVCILSGSGRNLWASTYFGGNGAEWGAHAVADEDGSVWLGASFTALEPPLIAPGAFIPDPAATSSGLILQLGPLLGSIEAFTYTGNRSPFPHGGDPFNGLPSLALTGDHVLFGAMGLDPAFYDFPPGCESEDYWVVALDRELKGVERLDCLDAAPTRADLVDVAVGPREDVYLAGITSPGHPIVNAFQPEPGSEIQDGFVARLGLGPSIFMDPSGRIDTRDFHGYVSYDVVLGSLGELRDPNTGLAGAQLECQGNDTAPGQVELPSPAPGDGLFILVRGELPHGDGSWDTGPGLVESRDTILADHPESCPGTTSCAHPLCVEAGPLDPACDPCVASVCDLDASCCMVAWDAACTAMLPTVCGVASCESGVGECDHSLCEAGEPLTDGCDESTFGASCVSAVCGADASCCEETWSVGCVGAVASVCGLDCDPA